MFKLASRTIAPGLRRAQLATIYNPLASAYLQPRFYSSAALSNDEITRRIAESTTKFFKAPVDLKPETTLANDLGLDSLDSTEFLVAVEEEFDLEMSDDDANGLKTVGQIVEYIKAHPEAH